jgi:hypothetical protein
VPSDKISRGKTSDGNLLKDAKSPHEAADKFAAKLNLHAFSQQEINIRYCFKRLYLLKIQETNK